MLTRYLACLAGMCFCFSASAQLVINEVAPVGSIMDAAGDEQDWIEVFNGGPSVVNLSGYALSDDALDPLKWPMPDALLLPGMHFFALASGNNVYANIHHWESPVLNTNTRKYFIGVSEPPALWNTAGFDDAAWSSGSGGIGYGDGDDNTTIAGTISVYMRCSFTIDDLSVIESAKLHADYDDAFVAYINGVEIARSGNIIGSPPAYNTLAGLEHEAGMYAGYPAEEWNIAAEVMDALLTTGENVLSIQVHNVTAGSSDLSSNFWLSFGISSPATFFDPVPVWFVEPFVFNETSFGIGNTGETIYLSDDTGTILDAVFTGEVEYGQSFARIPDGAAWCITPAITPTYSNNTATCFAGYEPDPVFSLEAGFYSGTQLVTITAASPTAEIRYTTDGSAVTPTSTVYTGPVTINENTVLSARCYSTGALLPGDQVKRTYFIDEDAYTLPILSISVDPGSLFDYDTGIYELGCCYDAWYPYFGANFWQPWERYAHAAYFTAEGDPQWEKEMSLEIHGGWSRAEAQKGFRVDFKGKYDGELEYPLWGGKPDMGPINNFNIRSGGQHVWTYKIQDAFLAQVMKDTYIDYEEWQPVMVFINGDPWGLYELREKADEHFVESNYGIDNDQVDFLNAWSVLNGSDTGWLNMYYALMDLSPGTDAFYTTFDQYVDLQNYTDYYIGQIYYQNVDFGGYYWGANNMKLWRDRNGGKWRFLMYDLDGAMGFFGSLPADNYIELTRNPSYPSTFSQVFDRVLDNIEYRNYFVNRFADLINTIYTNDNMESIVYTMRDSIITEIPHQVERWGAPTEATVDTYVESMLTYNSSRRWNARAHINSSFGLSGQRTLTLEVSPEGAGYILLNTIVPQELPWSGIYFDGVPVTMTAIANPGYTFSNWEANALLPTGSTDISITINMDESEPFTAVFNGTPLTPEIVVSEVNYNSNDDVDMGDWMELHNAGDFTVDLSMWEVRDGSDAYSYTIPAGTTLAPGAYLVVAGDPDALAVWHPGLSNVVGGYYFDWNNSGDMIRLFDAGGQLRMSMTYSDDAAWPQGADGTGRTLELADAGASMNDPNNWFDGCIGGSPGTAYVPCDDAVVFGEINYNSAAATDAGDWIEILNASGATMDISGWLFADDADSLAFTIPDATVLEPGERIVLVRDPDLFESRHPAVDNYAGAFKFGLDAGGEEVRLFDHSGMLQFTMIYNDAAPWPTEADGGGKTLELLDAHGRMTEPENWFAGCPEGSPGTAYDADCVVDVEEWDQSTPKVELMPNPANDLVYLYTQGFVEQAVITVVDIAGQLIEYRVVSTTAGMTSINCSDWPAGVYQVVVTDVSHVAAVTLIVQ